MRLYRVMRKGGLYYPQVQEIKPFLYFWTRRTKWKRIGVHVEGFGLYPSDNYKYGLTMYEADGVLLDYEKQFLDTSKPELQHYVSQSTVEDWIREPMKPRYKTPQQVFTI